MSSEPVQRALALFREACELPSVEQTAFLDNACGQDAELRAEVESMLAWDEAEDEDEAPHPVREALADLAWQAESGAGPSSIPESVGSYRIVRIIAHGGMGVVYEARQENPERRVALKVARTGGTTSERARRFELEAQLLARLHHPGIAQIIEAGTTPPEEGAQPFFVMEYVEGQSLTAFADEYLPSGRSRVELMVSVCEAVAFAHAQGVVHRDLKPDNVYVEAGGTPKVLDFGVAKVQDAGGFGAATLRTEAGRVLGTMGYMAPEQLGGRTEGLGPTADVYSLGVMIYELLTGRLPHELTAATLTRALAVVSTTDAPLLGVIRPEYRGDIEAVVAKALEKDPRHRYADAAALKTDLERYLRDEPVLARRHSAFHRARKFARRHRALVGGVAATIVALTLGLIAALYFLGRFQGKVREFNELAVVSRHANLVAAEEGNLVVDEEGNLVVDEEGNLVAAEEGLYPAWPRNLEAMNAWLEECAELMKLEKGIKETVAALQARPHLDEASQFLLDTLGALLKDLRDLEDHQKVRVVQALAWAGKIEALSKNHPKWKEAGDAIAKADGVVASGLYAGQEIEFGDGVLGLVPIGMNPQSKLWEFYHLRTAWDGTSDPASIPIPTHNPDGSIEMTHSTGMVFVLIPGGSFWMGSWMGFLIGHLIPYPDHFKELPVHRVTCPPFFISKYEMTWGQWWRAGGESPLSMPRWFMRLSPPEQKRLPVSLVSRRDSAEMMRRLGLVLPNEEQWEYAARAGTTTIWPLGNDIRDLDGRANVRGQEARRNNPQRIFYWDKGLTDDHAGIAGVGHGEYPPNNWGLYNVTGNLSEWCSNRLTDYKTGLPFPEAARGAIFRGGSFYHMARTARSSMRATESSIRSLPFVGLRPAMDIQR